MQGQRAISISIYDLSTNKGRNKCNPLFYVILSGKTISYIIYIVFMIQSHLRVKKVNFKVK